MIELWLGFGFGFILFVALAIHHYRKRQQHKAEIKELQRELERYRGIRDAEAEEVRIKQKYERLAREGEDVRRRIDQEISALKRDAISTREQIKNLNAEVRGLEETRGFQEVGLYEPKYNLDASIKYKARIDEIRKRQKQMIKEKTAAICTIEWALEGSKAKGRRMMERQLKLMLRAFNGECDALILKVKYNNIHKIETRIDKARQAINKLAETNKCLITETYFDLKIDELHLVHEYEEKKQAERELQREIKAQMREEQRAQKELEKAQREAQKEEERYQKALVKARRDVANATGQRQAELQAKLERLNQLLEEAREKNQRAISQAQMTRSGHVYIISNVGSFGEGIYKIGMTRRLEPMDRVKELGSASVPFLFDVHAMIYTEDAPKLEKELHDAFDDKRVNRVNARKEFFRVRLEEIAQFVEANHHGEIEFAFEAEAEEYRKTQAIMMRHHPTRGSGFGNS